MICANRFARIALRIACATKLTTASTKREVFSSWQLRQLRWQESPLALSGLASWAAKHEKTARATTLRLRCLHCTCPPQVDGFRVLLGGYLWLVLVLLLSPHPYHLSQDYYITARYFWTINFGSCNVKISSEIVLELFLGATILTGDLSDFCTVISDKLGLWEN